MKKLSTLLTQRRDLLQQARLANLALAYNTLDQFVRRISRAQLSGAVTLSPALPREDRFCATLTAHEGSQSVIEEHFTDEDLIELADGIAFSTGDDEVDVTFQLEEIAERFLVPLRNELETAGVQIDRSGARIEEPR